MQENDIERRIWGQFVRNVDFDEISKKNNGLGNGAIDSVKTKSTNLTSCLINQKENYI